MNCDRIRELASEALDDSLTGSCAARFQAHVDACPPCRAFLAGIKESLLLLEELPTIEVGNDFDRLVWSRIREDQVHVGWWESSLRRIRAYQESMAPVFARWSPIAVAAGVLTVFAVTSMPVERVVKTVPNEPVEVSSTRNAPAQPSANTVSQRERPSRLASVEATAGSESSDEDRVEAASEEEFGIPRAVEAYLNSGRELRPKSSQQYLRSNYSYPLPRVSAGAVQVGSEGRPVYGAGAPANAGGTTVISF